MTYQAFVYYNWWVFKYPDSPDLYRCEIDHAEAYSALGVEDKNITRANLILQNDESIIFLVKKWLGNIKPDLAKNTFTFIDNDYSVVDSVFLNSTRGSIFKNLPYILEFIFSASLYGLICLCGAIILSSYLEEGVEFFNEKRELENQLYVIRKAEGTLAQPYTPMPWIQVYTDFHEEFKWRRTRWWCTEALPKRYRPKINKKNRVVFWWDAWSFANTITSLEKIPDTPWSMYKKYRLSIWTNWHVLEERIVLFLIIFYFILI